MAKQNDEWAAEFGWYLRNCVLSATASRVQSSLFKGVSELRETNDGDDWDFTDPRQIRILKAELKRCTKVFGEAPIVPPGSVILLARDEFELDAIEVEILQLLICYERNHPLENLADSIAHKLKHAPQAIAVLIGAETREVEARLKRSARLAESGLVIVDEDCKGIGQGCFAGLGPQSRKTITRSWVSRKEWLAALTGPTLSTDLAWEDFAHLGSTRELARELLGGAAQRRARGVNVLLHGPVGTGKTEFAKVLAAATGLPIFAVAEADDDGDEPSRGARLASLRLLQRLLKGRTGALILLDEAEDVLANANWPFPGGARRGSKVHANRLLETNAVPVIWTCNDIHSMDPAVLRRMSLAIEVRTAARPARARIWRRVMADAELALGDEAAERLAARYEAPAAIAANAARTAALARGGESEIERALDGLLALIGKRATPKNECAPAFDPGYLNCEEDVVAITERLVRPGAPRDWSLCLSGPSGTGKSEYARYLANRLELEVLHTHASDLLSMFVGESEQNIARAFAEARDACAMLVFDEADSLLADRRGAVRSWEVSQVNEMLTWMERHPLPFVCTTNVAERLDEASLRRFTFKLRFDPLSREQAERLFAHAFAAPAPSSLPHGLTPGDFATVKKRAGLFGETDPIRLAAWLGQEVEARGRPARPIGFAA